MSIIESPIGRAVQHPVLSPDHCFLAFVTPQHSLRIIGIRVGRIVCEVQFSKSIKGFLAEAQILQWAPNFEKDNEHDGTSRRWILLAGGSRLVVIEVCVPALGSAVVTEAQVMADYEFEVQHGKINIANFVFNHQQALVTFEFNTYASVISFAKLQRDDIASPKFRDQQGFAQSNRHNHFTLVLRPKGQDQVAVFTSQDGCLTALAAFSPQTLDCQGIKWSPQDDPVLLVWESAAHGLKAHFFTAMGHHLKHLDLSPETLMPKSMIYNSMEIGITHLNWTQSTKSRTLLASSIAGVQLLLREQDHGSLDIPAQSLRQHNSIVDCSKCNLWQELDEQAFERQSTVFDLQIKQHSEINLIAINADASLVSTRLATLPRILWIWSASSANSEEQPTAIVHFKHDIRRVAWHPGLPNVLIIDTTNKQPCIYVIHDLHASPQMIVMPFDANIPTARRRMQWVETPNSSRHPLIVSSSKQFEIGLVSRSDGQITFDSILNDSNTADETHEDSSLIDTPSKPSMVSRPTAGWLLDGTNGLWDARSDVDAW